MALCGGRGKTIPEKGIRNTTCERGGGRRGFRQKKQRKGCSGTKEKCHHEGRHQNWGHPLKGGKSLPSLRGGGKKKKRPSEQV